MNLESAWARMLFVMALGLAAISGLSAVLEALVLPPWLIRMAVLTALVATLGLAGISAFQGRSIR